MAAKKKIRAHRLPVSNFRLDKTTLKYLAMLAKEESKQSKDRGGPEISKAGVVRMAIHERYHKKKRDT